MILSSFFNCNSSSLTLDHLSVTGKSPNVIHHDFFLRRNWYSVCRENSAYVYRCSICCIVLTGFWCIIALRLCIKNQLLRRSNKKCPLPSKSANYQENHNSCSWWLSYPTVHSNRYSCLCSNLIGN